MNRVFAVKDLSGNCDWPAGFILQESGFISAFRFQPFSIFFGEVAERSNAAASKAVVRLVAYRGFESLPHRHGMTG